MTRQKELRCPLDRQRMFGKLHQGDGPLPAGFTVDFTCDKCRRATGHKTVHVFDIATGDVVRTYPID